MSLQKKNRLKNAKNEISLLCILVDRPMGGFELPNPPAYALGKHYGFPIVILVREFAKLIVLWKPFLYAILGKELYKGSILTGLRTQT